MTSERLDDIEAAYQVDQQELVDEVRRLWGIFAALYWETGCCHVCDKHGPHEEDCPIGKVPVTKRRDT